MQSDEVMRLLSDKRVMTIHQQPVRPHAHVNVGIREHLIGSIDLFYSLRGVGYLAYVRWYLDASLR